MSQTVLVVDDEQKLVDLLRTILEKEGYNVVELLTVTISVYLFFSITQIQIWFEKLNQVEIFDRF